MTGPRSGAIWPIIQCVMRCGSVICNDGDKSSTTKFAAPTWGPPGADRTQVGPMLTPWTLLSGNILTAMESGGYANNFNRAQCLVICNLWYISFQHTTVDWIWYSIYASVIPNKGITFCVLKCFEKTCANKIFLFSILKLHGLSKSFLIEDSDEFIIHGQHHG